MYSRAERQFLNPSKDQSNPLLGPGCYTLEPNPRRKSNFAPFSSLASRTSYFAKNTSSGPPPGIYHIESSMITEGGSIFARSTASRFQSKIVKTPGPAAYDIRKDFSIAASKRVKKTCRPDFSLNLKPVQATKGDSLAEAKEKKRIDYIEDDSDLEDSSDVPAYLGLSVKSTKSPKQQPRPASSSIIWEKAFIPPSIPVGKYMFGYKEKGYLRVNLDGVMIPRNPPTPIIQSNLEIPSALIDSKKGPTFSKSSERPDIKVSTNPGPGSYDIFKGQKFLNTSHAIKIASPGRRVTEEIIANSQKQHIPGPGSYNVKNIRKPSTNSCTFGSIGEGFLNLKSKMFVPGPGAYNLDRNDNKKIVQNHQQISFGSSAKRLLADGEINHDSPPIGSYEVEKFNTIGRQGTYYRSPNQQFAFGSLAARFSEKEPVLAPGPAEYDAFNANQHKNSSSGFVSHSVRFDNHFDSLPPPGAYDIPGSFDTKKTEYSKSHGILASRSKRGIFKVDTSIPGPAEYLPITRKRPIRVQTAGAFLTSEKRFEDLVANGPGPGSYRDKSSFVKKSFNVTLDKI